MDGWRSLLWSGICSRTRSCTTRVFTSTAFPLLLARLLCARRFSNLKDPSHYSSLAVSITVIFSRSPRASVASVRWCTQQVTAYSILINGAVSSMDPVRESGRGKSIGLILSLCGRQDGQLKAISLWLQLGNELRATCASWALS